MAWIGRNMAVRAPQAPLADRSGSRRGTLMHIVERCEGTLGWLPKGEGVVGRRKSMALEASKLRKVMERDPQRLTVANLELALEWCWKQRLRITSPMALVYHVDDALKMAAQPEKPVDIIAARDAAIEYEKHHDDTDSERWLRRLSRAQGAGLVATVDDWRHARGR